MSKEVKRYLVYTYILTWFLWGGIVVSNRFNLLQFGTISMMIPFIAGGLMPTIVAIWLKKKYSSKEAYKKFIKNIINIKYPLGWYVLVICFAFLFSYVQFLSGGATIERPIYFAFLIFPVMIIGGGLEEIGWRGYLQPELIKRYSPLVSTIVVGVFWVLWHLPLWFITGSSQQDINFLWYVIIVMGLSFLLTVIYLGSESIFLCISFHALINAFGEVFDTKNNIISALVALILAITVYIVFAILHKRNIKSGMIQEKV